MACKPDESLKPALVTSGVILLLMFISAKADPWALTGFRLYLLPLDKA